MPLLIAALALATPLASPDSDLLKSWGLETIENIRRDYYIPETKLYADDFVVGKTDRNPAFNWGVGVMLTALNAAARLDPKYKPVLEEYATASRVYWNDKGPVPGYDVLPCPKPVDRYYDDNAWMVLALVDTYEILGDKKYLDWAQETLKYVMSGEDLKFGGGIYWKEVPRETKNTCSNAPSAAACLAIFRHTKNQRQLVDAIRLYGWTKKNLQDPEDFLFVDGLNKEGKAGGAKWSYNTALMIRSAADLYSITKNPQYLTDLKAMQSASAKRWLNDRLRDEGRFAHLLLDAWIFQRAVCPVPNPQQEVSDAKAILSPLMWLRVNGRSESGFYGKRFDAAPKEDQTKFELLDQASAARAYLSAALYYRDVER